MLLFGLVQILSCGNGLTGSADKNQTVHNEMCGAMLNLITTSPNILANKVLIY